MATSTSPRPAGRLGIGEVLRRLRSDFPDVSISKIRFLEAEGLIEPQRTASGYRKFSYADVEQLRYVLSAQRDQYLPLKVIREHLDVMARGMQPPLTSGGAPQAPRPAPASGPGGTSEPTPALRMSRTELLANSGLTDGQLAQLHDYGLVHPDPDTGHYDEVALTISTSVASLARFGLEPRHLRSFKTAADREMSLIDQALSPLLRTRGQDLDPGAERTREELADVALELHAALVRQAVRTPR